jgi:thiol-disulfide isomerase/thioredoxin
MTPAEKFSTALKYQDFLAKYATPDQKQRWANFRDSFALTEAQLRLLSSFSRDMKVLVLAGAWCGDCVNQCPIFDKFAEACPRIDVRYLDRDANQDMAEEFAICGGARVPSVIFLSEDGYVCGRYGDRTLAKYRSVVAALGGEACSTGLAVDGNLTQAVIQDWLDEFERIQWMLRTSGRLRQLHGD